MYMSDPMRIYTSLPEYTPFQQLLCDTPKNYPSLREYTFFDNYMTPPPSLLKYFPPPLSTTICDISQSLNKPLSLVERRGYRAPPGNQFLIDVSSLKKNHRKRFAMLKS